MQPLWQSHPAVWTYLLSSLVTRTHTASTSFSAMSSLGLILTEVHSEEVGEVTQPSSSPRSGSAMLLGFLGEVGWSAERRGSREIVGKSGSCRHLFTLQKLLQEIHCHLVMLRGYAQPAVCSDSSSVLLLGMNGPAVVCRAGAHTFFHLAPKEEPEIECPPLWTYQPLKLLLSKIWHA